MLLLLGAKFLYGYHAQHWPFMDRFDGATRDRRNGHDSMPACVIKIMPSEVFDAVAQWL